VVFHFLHRSDPSRLQEKWWNVWLTITYRSISNTEKDNQFQVLWLALIMLNIFDREEERIHKWKSKTKSHIHPWIFATRTHKTRRDASCTGTKLPYWWKIVKETVHQSIPCLNHKFGLRLTSTASSRRWSSFQETKLALDFLLEWQKQKDLELHQTWIICHHQWRKDIKSLNQVKLSQDYLVMTWKLQTLSYVKTTLHIVLAQMIKSHWQSKEQVMFTILTKSAVISSPKMKTGTSCRICWFKTSPSSISNSRIQQQESRLRVRFQRSLWETNMAIWSRQRMYLTSPTLLVGNSKAKNQNALLVITSKFRTQPVDSSALLNNVSWRAWKNQTRTRGEC